MERNEFYRAMMELDHFMHDQDKAEEALKLFMDGHPIFCFGNDFIDAYIRVLSIAVEDHDEWISWFVFENDFGRKKMEAGYDGKETEIDSVQKLFDLIKEGK